MRDVQNKGKAQFVKQDFEIFAPSDVTVGVVIPLVGAIDHLRQRTLEKPANDHHDCSQFLIRILAQ